MKNLEREKEEFERFIRKFNTCNLLEFFSVKSMEAFQNNKKAFSFIDIPYYNKITGGIRIVRDFCYGQWELVQICYYAIKYSNDYRGTSVNDASFYQLLNENKRYDEMMENIKENMDPVMLFEHIQCLSNVQFDFQTPQAINRFNRVYQIMVSINNNPKYDQSKKVCYINFTEEFKKITGMDMKKFIKAYMFILLLSISGKNANLYNLIEKVELPSEKLSFTRDDLLKLIQIESRDYNFYRQTNNWNSLKFHPIVKASKDKYIISNIFSLVLRFPNAVYWIIRDYYKNNNCTDFTIYFGKCFEHYFSEVLDCYNIKYEKLKESSKQRTKTPDLKIETDEYILLIEQKSTLFSIDARTTTKDERYIKVEDYINNTIIKAFNQLNSYKIEKPSKTVIRICLTFEKIYMEENIKYILELMQKTQSEIEFYWIVNIDEMEILMHILGKNQKKFNEIMKNKIELEKSKDINGRSLEKLFAGYSYDYTINHINHFERIANELKDDLKE